MKLLFLSQRVPYPPNRGDKITTWRLVERMSRTHEVRAVAFAHDDADREAARQLTEMGIPTTAVDFDERRKKIAAIPLLLTGTPLTLGVYGSRELQREVDELAGWADAAYAYSSSMGAFLEPHELPRVMHFGELDSDKWRQYAARTSFPMSLVYAREARTLQRFEERVARAFTDNVFCTPLEQRIFDERIPGCPSTVLRNGVDLEQFAPAPDRAESGHLVFTGVMNYYPNVDGCVWFCDEILPRVRERHPDARFSIVGSKPSPEVVKLGERDGVTVTGFVDSTAEWMARAQVAVAPLRIARGIQNKVLEAMAMGLPTVGTTSATQGVEGDDERDYLVADDAAAFADRVIRLLDDAAAARELGARARRFVEDHYNWETVFQPLDDILERCARAARSTDR